MVILNHPDGLYKIIKLHYKIKISYFYEVFIDKAALDWV